MQELKSEVAKCLGTKKAEAVGGGNGIAAAEAFLFHNLSSDLVGSSLYAREAFVSTTKKQSAYFRPKRKGPKTLFKVFGREVRRGLVEKAPSAVVPSKHQIISPSAAPMTVPN